MDIVLIISIIYLQSKFSLFLVLYRAINDKQPLYIIDRQSQAVIFPTGINANQRRPAEKSWYAI